MPKSNRHIFDTLSHDLFFKTTEQAARVFRDISLFPDAIGFDEISGGFLVLHRDHAPSGFVHELPVCVILKKAGFRVMLGSV